MSDVNYQFLTVTYFAIGGFGTNLFFFKEFLQGEDIGLYYHFLSEGGILLDKRPCHNYDNPIYGPFLNIHLPDSSIENEEGIFYCYDPYEKRGNESVSLDLYIDFWKRHGAEVAVRKENFLFWNDGIVEEIIV